MRRTAVARCGVFLALAVLLMGAKCPGIPETPDINITIITEEYIELAFEARGDINVESSADSISVQELREDLEGAGIDVSQVEEILVSSVEYGVTFYDEGPGNTDRRIVDADVTVTRRDDATSALLIDDLSVDVYPLLGMLAPVPIEPGGVAFINELLADLLAALKGGGDPYFVVVGEVSGVSEPTERTTNFDWRIRIYYQIAGVFPTESVTF